VKIILTGGAGFIGSHVAEGLLALGHKVEIIDSLITGRVDNLKKIFNEINFFEYDLAKISIDHLTKIFRGADVVIHLAAIADIVPSVDNPVSYFDNNVKSTVNVVEAARNADINRIVYAASSSCYGDCPEVPTGIHQSINCKYPYALTKFLGEELVKHWSNLYGIEFVSLRLFNIYGPRARTSGTYGAVMGVFLAQHLKGYELTIVGDGHQKRDFTYVTDTANAFILASRPGSPSGIFNISLGNPRKIIDLANLISPNKTFIPSRPGEPMITWGDSSPFRELFSWKPVVQLEEGVQLCLADMEWLANAPVWTPESIAGATNSWFKYLGDDK
jgi:UDP-glucose 4-epimerase